MTNDRGRTTTRRKVLQGAAKLTAGGAALAAFGPASPAEAAKIYQWGSASLGSTGYQIITVLAAAVTKHSDLRCSSLSTAGGAENMALLGEGIIDFGQSTTTDWMPAIKGLGRYKKPVKAYQMFSYTVWQCTPMVLADSDIMTLEDLAGKRVMPATAGGATAGMWKTLFEAAGIADKVKWTYGSWTESYNALKSGAVDCIPSLLTSGNPSGRMIELEVARKVRMLPISAELIAKAAAMNPGVMEATVTPETYKSLAAPQRFVSFAGILAVHPRIDEETGYAVTKAVYDNAAEVRKKGKVQLKDVEIDFATKYLMPAYPVHPGAARYFKEKGVWRDELTIAKL